MRTPGGCAPQAAAHPRRLRSLAELYNDCAVRAPRAPAHARPRAPRARAVCCAALGARAPSDSRALQTWWLSAARRAAAVLVGRLAGPGRCVTSKRGTRLNRPCQSRFRVYRYPNPNQKLPVPCEGAVALLVAGAGDGGRGAVRPAGLRAPALGRLPAPGAPPPCRLRPRAALLCPAQRRDSAHAGLAVCASRGRMPVAPLRAHRWALQASLARYQRAVGVEKGMERMSPLTMRIILTMHSATPAGASTAGRAGLGRAARRAGAGRGGRGRGRRVPGRGAAARGAAGRRADRRRAGLPGAACRVAPGAGAHRG